MMCCSLACHIGRGLSGELLLDWVSACTVGACCFRTNPNRGIPVIMNLTSKKYPSECRLEASNFIRLLCHSSVLTLQMFISYVSSLSVDLLILKSPS